MLDNQPRFVSVPRNGAIRALGTVARLEVPARQTSDRMTPLKIAGHELGTDRPPFVVAELSANHAGRIEKALAMIEAAKAAGADAVKLQTYTADTLTIDDDGPDFRIKGGLWDGRRLYDLYQEAHTPWAWHHELFAKGQELGITIFSTPFDASAVDFLEEIGVPAYKIASFEMIDLPLVRRVAATGKPTVISTGMATQDEIQETVDAFRAAGGGDFVLLHCVSGYPTPMEQANLRRIPELAARFGCPVGLSDHTLGIEAAIASVALGACMIEKHFTLSHQEESADAVFSLEPQEFAAMASGARAAFAALGSGRDRTAAVEEGSKVFRRSIYVVRDISAGEPFTDQNVRIIRPGFGLAPKHLPDVLGRTAAKAIKRGTALTWDVVA